MPFNFFATVEVNQITYVDDVAHVVALRRFQECGNEHYARLFDQIRADGHEEGDEREAVGHHQDQNESGHHREHLGARIHIQAERLRRTERHDRHQKRDGNGAEEFQRRGFYHKSRGQHPDRWSDLDNAEENEIMAEAEEDEYLSMDEIRGIWRNLTGRQNPEDVALRV
eukprot:495585-Heterocapsa_arctica.AAC.1